MSRRGGGADPMTTSSFPILTVIIFLPVAGALLCALLPGDTPESISRRVGMAFAVAELGLVAYLVVDFPVGQAGFQYLSTQSWIGAFGIGWRVGVDGISLFL